MTIKDINKNALPTCDNDCTLLGWIEYEAFNDFTDSLHVSVKPNQRLDEVMTAFCHDEQEIIKIKGHSFTFEKIEA